MPVQMLLSRAVRRVPLGWEHPTDARGFVPLHDGFAERVAAWDRDRAAWDRGERPDYARRGESMTFEEWDGPRPQACDYMPEFDAPDGLCMYEEITEGTPISAVYPDTDEGRDAMARELAASPGGIARLSVDEWREIIDGGSGAVDLHTGAVEIR